MRLEDLDFDIPAELVAQHPAAERDACRLLRLQRSGGKISAHLFRDLPQLLRPGDVLVRNTSRVLPARLHGEKEGTGARCEMLLLEPAAGGWWALVRPARRLGPGSRIRLADGTRAELAAAEDGGRRLVVFPPGVDGLDVMHRLGTVPLPPYIRRPAEPGDAEAYQTVYARVEGSLAAPTAGLHFTPAVFAALGARGIACVDVVLHVAAGSFTPVRTPDPSQHRMHWERFAVERGVLEKLKRARRAGGRVVAVGTTSARVLESVAQWTAGDGHADVELQDESGVLQGRTRLFIHPPHEFRCVDVLLTNFHLPRSTLLLLVDAFAGREARARAYALAVAHRYRFFSYGDAMLIE